MSQSRILQETLSLTVLLNSLARAVERPPFAVSFEIDGDEREERR